MASNAVVQSAKKLYVLLLRIVALRLANVTRAPIRPPPRAIFAAQLLEKSQFGVPSIRDQGGSPSIQQTINASATTPAAHAVDPAITCASKSVDNGRGVVQESNCCSAFGSAASSGLMAISYAAM